MGRLPTILSKFAQQFNQPLLTTPRESEQLLRALQKSFGKSLDREHPHPRRRQSGPVDAHVNAIVRDPLLRARANQTSLRQELLVAPQHSFQREVATGNATLDTAKVCLTSCAKRYAVSGMSESSGDAAELVRCVERWLWASGMTDSMEFVHDEAFVKVFFDSMSPAAASLRASQWYNKLSSITTQRLDSRQSYKEYTRAMGQLFRRVVFGSIKRAKQSDLQFLMESYITKSKMVDAKLPRSIRNGVMRSALDPILHLLLLTTEPKEIDNAVYSHVTKITEDLTYHNPWISAVLALKHPTTPSHLEALSFFKALSPARLQDLSSWKRAGIFKLAGATVDFLLASGNAAEAQSLLDRLQKPIQKELPKDDEDLRWPIYPNAVALLA